MIAFFLKNLFLLLILIFKLENLLGCIFIFPSQFSKQNSHLLDLLLKILIILFHKSKFLLPFLSFFNKRFGNFRWWRYELFLKVVNFGHELAFLFLMLLWDSFVLLFEWVKFLVFRKRLDLFELRSEFLYFSLIL